MNQHYNFAEQLLKELNNARQHETPLYPNKQLNTPIENILLYNEQDSNFKIEKYYITQALGQQVGPQDIYIIHETTFKQDGFYQHTFATPQDKLKNNLISNQYLSVLSGKSRFTFQQMFDQVLQSNRMVLLSSNFTHCHIHLFESCKAQHLILILVRYNLIVDSIQFKQNYILINGWMTQTHFTDHISGATLFYEDTYLHIGNGCIKSYSQNETIVFQFLIPNEYMPFPLVHLNVYGLEVPQIGFYVGPKDSQAIKVLSSIPNNYRLVFLTELVEQPSAIQNRNSNQFSQFILYIYDQWSQQRQSIGSRRKSSLLQENNVMISNLNQLSNRLHVRSYQKENKNTPNCSKLPAIMESARENMQSSAKPRFVKGNDMDMLTSGLLSKYGLDNLSIDDNQIFSEEGYDKHVKNPFDLHNLDNELKKVQQNQEQQTPLNKHQQFNLVTQSQFPNQNNINFSQNNNDNNMYVIEYPQQNFITPINQNNVLQPIHNPFLPNHNNQQQFDYQQIMQPQPSDLYMQYMQQLYYQQQEMQYWVQMQQMQQIQQDQQIQYIPDINQTMSSARQQEGIDELRSQDLSRIDLKSFSVQGPKQSSISQLFYSSSKYSRSGQILPASAINYKNQDISSSRYQTANRLSVRVAKLQSIKQNKLSKTKIKENGGFILHNESDHQPMLCIRSIQPYDFDHYDEHHAQAQMQEVLKELKNCKTRCLQDCHKSFASLYKDQKFSDILLKVGDQEYKTHKAVLICASPYFKQLLGSVGNQYTSIRLENSIESETFPLILQFLYLQKFSKCQWQELNLKSGKIMLFSALQFKITPLVEQLISFVIIPRMNLQTCIEWFSMCCTEKDENKDFSYVFDYLYHYLLKFFSLNSKIIMAPIKQFYLTGQQTNKSKSQELIFAEKYLDQLQKLSQQHLSDLVINALHKYQDNETMENLIWILSLRLKCKDNFELCKMFSQGYVQIRGGFSFRNYQNVKFEQYYPESLLDPFTILKQQPLKINARKNSIFLQDQKNTQNVEEQLFQQYKFDNGVYESNLDIEKRLNTLTQSQCDLELILNFDSQTPCFKSSYIVSQCFTSETTTWRMILDVDEENNVSLFINEKGSFKLNAQYLNFNAQEDAYIPETPNNDYISTIIRIEVMTEPKVLLTSKCLFHSFPTHQNYSAGFENLFSLRQIQRRLLIKVWIIESPVHSCTLNLISRNFEKLMKSHPNNITGLSSFDLYSIFSSDMLNVANEDALMNLFYEFDKQKRPEFELDLLLYPIRFTYLTSKILFSISRDCKTIRGRKLFQNYISLLFHWRIDNNHTNPMKRRIRYVGSSESAKKQQNSDFKKDLMDWLIESNHEEHFQLDVVGIKDQLKQNDTENNNFQNHPILTIKNESLSLLPLKQKRLPIKQTNEITKIIDQVIPKTVNKQSEFPCILI